MSSCRGTTHGTAGANGARGLLVALGAACLLLAGAPRAAEAGAPASSLSLRPRAAIAEAGAGGANGGPAEGAPVGTPSPGAAPGAVVPSSSKLSNERTLTTWAHSWEPGPIYARPELHSPRMGRLHLETEDGFPEVYMLLTLHIDALGREWVKVRIPGRPNGREGWVLRELLGGFNETRWLIVVNRERRHMRVYYDGKLRMVAPVGVGKPSTPTPAGHFWIRERFRLSSPSNPYWPYALGTADYSTLSEWPGGGVVGIHGPFGEPQEIPGDPSHGCIRMHAGNLIWLATHVTLGTPVDVT